MAKNQSRNTDMEPSWSSPRPKHGRESLDNAWLASLISSGVTSATTSWTFRFLQRPASSATTATCTTPTAATSPNHRRRYLRDWSPRIGKIRSHKISHRQKRRSKDGSLGKDIQKSPWKANAGQQIQVCFTQVHVRLLHHGLYQRTIFGLNL